MGLLVFKQPAGRKSQPLVKFCLLFIREVYIPCEASEFISDHLTLFIAKTHYSTPYSNREFDFGSRPPFGQIVRSRATLTRQLMVHLRLNLIYWTLVVQGLRLTEETFLVNRKFFVPL